MRHSLTSRNAGNWVDRGASRLLSPVELAAYRAEGEKLPDE